MNLYTHSKLIELSSISTRMERYLEYSLSRNIERWAPKCPGTPRDDYFKNLSCHPALNSATLKKFRHEKWDVGCMGRNKNFSWDWVDIFPTAKWNWSDLSFNAPTIDIVLRYLDKEWDWSILTIEPGVNFDDMAKYRNLPWNINNLLFTEITTDSDIDFLRIYAERYDDVAWVDHSRRATWEVVKKSPDLPWRYGAVNIVISDKSDVEFLIGKEGVSWGRLSTIAPASVILETKDTAPWHWNIVSVNKSLTYEQVVEHPDLPWSYSVVPVQKYSEELARKWMAAFRIQILWRRSISNPEYRLCRNRINLEFSNVYI